MKRPQTKPESEKPAEDAPGPSPERAAGLALQRQIIREMAKKSQEMFDDARSNPKSEASEMVQILLFTQLVNMEEELPEKDLKQVYGEQFRRHRLQKDLEIAKYDVERANKHLEQAGERNKILERRVKLAEDEAKEKQKRLDQAEREANKARAALENNQPMDAMAVYNRIAEIVGLRSPLVPIGGPGSAAGQ
ncbi:MAG TPA: hypothetical protein VMT20_19500 [Terriglobia bacterium]|nr:hypothetical protein [Terriglobia bacterium]